MSKNQFSKIDLYHVGYWQIGKNLAVGFCEKGKDETD